MVAVSLVQVKKLHWGKLSQISRDKLSTLKQDVTASKFYKYSHKNYESLNVVFHC